MIIKQILNNNVALLIKGDSEVIIVSKGVGFRHKKGDSIADEEIEKLFILDSYDMLEHFSHILSRSHADDIILINDIITYAEKILGIEASDYVNLALLDHIEFLFKRAQQEQFIKSPLFWDIKRYYPKHFEVGLHALKMIEEHLNMTLPQDEAVSLALHFVNMQGTMQESHEQTIQIMQILKDIMTIIEFHFKITLNEESTPFLRLTTHLQFFIQKLLRQEEQIDDFDTLELYKQVRLMHPQAHKCVQKIRIYIESRFNSIITASEEMYLMLHINHVIQAKRREEKSDEV